LQPITDRELELVMRTMDTDGAHEGAPAILLYFRPYFNIEKRY
jgi:hypothetical protein